ncbi:ABC transporter ATP-binding protein [Pyrococcus abyssi]|uniref:Molybdate/tungstate import ATP-binding protein WtpC n=1 Tax=Pyrococcus abyssi (strain GE5 / Orsay) TaxID=272844 RepID=Q9V0J1_PYRAB|nr:ABC transporter ATP-binding protein [Pyrococcus abyssi]CAB49712.1 ABC-transporter ATP-binding protein [Pyrococcus abyssi GE5]CCE70198.1 TPA: ABC transporter ATP-binding protein [Pyrococcus abyssi GE5]
MVRVELRGVEKKFPGFKLRVDLEVKDGELISILGPSGCGKTTTLRIIAGLERPDKGNVLFDGRDVTFLPPYSRNIGFVFQDYALFPHMNVFKNVAFGLEVRKLPRKEIERKVREVLELVGLKGFENRMPEQLSGGQQQRVALARALVIEPEVLLLDEPLSNLDAKVRESLRMEIKRIQKELGITTMYVTHDQEEAMAISDRIAVMNFGRIEQVGRPLELYYNPKTEFVAKFLGTGNLLKLRSTNGVACLGELCFNVGVDGPVKVFFRPESVEIGKEGVEAEVMDYEILPGRIRFRLSVQGKEIIAEDSLARYEEIPKKVYIKVKRFSLL